MWSAINQEAACAVAVATCSADRTLDAVCPPDRFSFNSVGQAGVLLLCCFLEGPKKALRLIVFRQLGMVAASSRRRFFFVLSDV